MSLSATIKIIDNKQAEEQIFFISEITNPNNLEYTDEDIRINIDLLENEALIISEDRDHKTELFLGKNAYLNIHNEYGILELPIEVLAYEKKGAIVYMAYMLEETEKKIIIEFGEV